MAKVYIGTSGYTYGHWRGVFYPQDLSQTKWLEFYSQHFQTVEINASFYHQMPRKVFENWRAKTPNNFIFAVKGSRFITHIRRLKDCQEPVERFLEAASGLGEKLKVILWQLPPKWHADPERLEKFLESISPREVRPPRRSDLLRNLRHAFEFRDESWLKPEIYHILKKYGVALVIQDSSNWPVSEEITTNFTYLRFHGRGSLYSSDYSDQELEEWAKKIKRWQKQNLDVFAYFNNDVGGYAIKNAQTLKELVRE